jgi:peptidylprolyl isomerase
MKKILFIIICISQTVMADGLQINNIVEGEGAEIINHSKIQVHYTGKLQDGTKFDSSYDRGQPFSFQIGLREVIEGWEIGLMGMKVGGKRTLIIPPELAYGARGAGDLIHPNATLTFDVELVAVQDPGYGFVKAE